MGVQPKPVTGLLGLALVGTFSTPMKTMARPVDICIDCPPSQTRPTLPPSKSDDYWQKIQNEMKQSDQKNDANFQRILDQMNQLDQSEKQRWEKLRNEINQGR
jgi:hypothetical protein